MTTVAPQRLSNLGLLAACVVVPRLLYLLLLLASDPDGDPQGLRAVAWVVDWVCLTIAALTMFPLQRDFGGDDTRLWARVAAAGFALDAVTTLLSRYVELHWVVVTIAVVAWVGGLTRWLLELCQRVGADYIVQRLWMISMLASYLVRFFRPEWPVFFFSFTILMIGLAVQLALVARAIRDDGGRKHDISPP